MSEDLELKRIAADILIALIYNHQSDILDLFNSKREFNSARLEELYEKILKTISKVPHRQ